MPVPSNRSLNQFFSYCCENNLPFAFYRLPDGKEIKIIAQKTSLLKIVSAQKQINQKGFLFAPFKEDKTFKKIIISPDILCNADSLPELNFSKNTSKTVTKISKDKLNEASKTQFLGYLRSIKKEIQNNTFEKVVAARVVKKKKPKHFNAVQFFKLLCKEYSSAFVSLVYTNKYGLWIGATPETLLLVNDKGYKTNSLAGTKENTKTNLKSEWGTKEKEEQVIVSDYVEQMFSTITKEKPLIEGPKTISAGNLLHLKTTFVYKSIPHSNWVNVAKQLHPTPAVAGTPKQPTINFILKNENENRSFYSGYLGPVNMDKQINLFVNLRCMNVLKESLAVYVGCGITADSKLEDEWKETVIKSETLLSLLKKEKQN